jgi:predicted enzyme related to lactoylglutathione lyase
MGDRTSYEPGTFSWVDLATPDAEGAKRFYNRLFGWEPEDLPAGDGDTYTMLRLDERNVAGLFQQGEEAHARGEPPHWNSYVTVEDADSSTQRATELGGEVLAGPFDVMEAGRMAMLQDPTGAAFAVWQARSQIGAALVNDVGAFCWNELATRDPDAAREFYAALFGWEGEVGEGGYTMIRNAGRLNGGIRPLTEEEGGVPPHWIVYFAVKSAEDAVRAAQPAGARTLVPPIDVSIGRFAVIADPQGAPFGVFEGDTDP